MDYKYQLGVIGAGNMAFAIVNGIVRTKMIDASSIIAADPFQDLGVDGVLTVRDNKVVFTQCKYILIAVKPQVFRLISADFNTILAEGVISIMAGIPSSFIENTVPINCEVVRVMPNTPCMKGMGMTCIADNAYSDSMKAFAKNIFSSVGKVKFIKENLFDAVTSVSGSGPAYVYQFIEFLARAGVKGGLEYDDALVMAKQTVVGAAALSIDSDKNMQELIDAVCSKGGTTIEAVNYFDNNGLEDIIDNAVSACRRRSEELSRE